VAEERSPSSPRGRELARRAYEYVGRNGFSGLSLRPLAEAIGTSPGVLMFIFGSKEGVVRAILAEARADQLRMLGAVSASHPDASLEEVAESVWAWLSAPDHLRLLNLWVEAYGRSLTAPEGPWARFAHDTVTDWLGLLRSADTGASTDDEVTAVLALLRGSLLDLLATGDEARVSSAFRRALSRVVDS
jgi:AcrR family transcriptional regulator